MNYQSSSVGLGAVVLVEPFNGLPGGATITNLEIKIAVLGTGHVRAKIFDAKSGGNLLGESSDITPSGTGFLEIPITATIPANGTVYAGYEISSSSTESSRTVSAGTSYFMTHTYGAGPSTFTYDTTNGALYYEKLTYNGPTPQVRVKIYDSKSNGTLLGQSGSTNIVSTGVLTVPVTAIIPANGTVYGAFEMTNPNTLFFRSLEFSPPIAYTMYHTFGAGPSIFTYNFSNSALYYEELTFGPTGPSIDYSTDGSISGDIASITQCYNVTGSDAFLIQQKLYNFTTELLQTKNFSPPIDLPVGFVTCPWTFYKPFTSDSSFNVVSTFNDTVNENNSPPVFDTNSTVITPGKPTLHAYASSQTSVRLVSVAGTPGDHPAKDYSLRCSVNNGAVTTVVSNSTLPTGRIYEYTGLFPNDSITCSWRDGSLDGWGFWSDNATSSTKLPLVQTQRPANSNPLYKVITWLDSRGGIYFGFSVIPLAVMLLGMLATPKTTGIFTIIVLCFMGILHGSGIFVYPAWFWLMSILLAIVLVLGRANLKER